MPTRYFYKSKSHKTTKLSGCKASITYKYDETESLYKFAKANHSHNQDLSILESKVSEKMIEDMHSFSKNDKVSSIKDFLEKKYKTKLNYIDVYHAFRNIFPRFGNEDASNLLKLLEQRNYLNFCQISLDDNKINKILFFLPNAREIKPLFRRSFY